MEMTEPSSCAARARRYRRRKRKAITLVPVEVSPEAINALYEYDLLPKKTSGASDYARIASAIELLLTALTERAVEIKYDRFDASPTSPNP